MLVPDLKIAPMPANRILEAKEIIQAGDNFLAKVDCPNCKAENLSGLTLSVCTECEFSLINYVVKLPSREKFRLLSGTRRKNLSISKGLVKRLYDMCEGTCSYCFKALEDYHIDHIVPLSVGGTNNIVNLALACPKCNLKVSDLCFSSLDEKRRYLSKVK